MSFCPQTTILTEDEAKPLIFWHMSWLGHCNFASNSMSRRKFRRIYRNMVPQSHSYVQLLVPQINKHVDKLVRRNIYLDSLLFLHPFKIKHYKDSVAMTRKLVESCIQDRMKRLDRGENCPHDLLERIIQRITTDNGSKHGTVTWS